MHIFRNLLLTLLVYCSVSGSAMAWGAKGHAAIAELAQKNLTPAAQAQVEELLRDDLDRHGEPSGRTTLAQIASWPDEIRAVALKDTYRGWHGRNNSVCDDELGPCRDGHCVDENIIHFAGILRDRKQSHRARNEALKWVVHLVGDLHQPLHSGVAGDYGYVRVILEGLKAKPGTTLHQAWDSQLAVPALAQGPLEGRLTALASLPANAPTAWMEEARDIARRYVYDPIPGFSCSEKLKAPVLLDHAYQGRAIPVIRERMETAGLRLARLLNQLLR